MTNQGDNMEHERTVEVKRLITYIGPESGVKKILSESGMVPGESCVRLEAGVTITEESCIAHEIRELPNWSDGIRGKEEP